MNRRFLAYTIGWTMAACVGAQSEEPRATILEIDVQNNAFYWGDVFEFSKLATDPGPTSPAPSRNFATHLGVGDIVAVNGSPARGTWVWRGVSVNFASNPNPGQAIADTGGRFAVVDLSWEILHPDGRPIGTIMATGLAGGAPPPGAPLVQTLANLAIMGGTGAFLGVRGQGGVRSVVQGRTASVLEDPANRRIHAGGAIRWVLHLVPISRVEILGTANGPVVVHASDFTLVTSAKPAHPGEILSLIATGLGPTRPGVDPGKPFSTNPLQSVSSPIGVTVSGKPAEILAAVGYPGAIDAYQVNFRLPPDSESGLATLQLIAAWTGSPEVRIPIQ